MPKSDRSERKKSRRSRRAEAEQAELVAAADEEEGTAIEHGGGGHLIPAFDRQPQWIEDRPPDDLPRLSFGHFTENAGGVKIIEIHACLGKGITQLFAIGHA